MADNTITNWFGDIISHPQVVVDAHAVDDIVAVLKDPAKYPSPVRAVGSNHSTSACGTADGGTLIRMKMDRPLSIGGDTLTVEAGAKHLVMARELEKHQLQFYINTEIGSLTAGSAACAGTKDASMPGEFGQVGSYVIGVKMVLPSGELLEVTEDRDPELMQKIRGSYGTFGIVYEVTYRVRPLTPLAVHHKTFELEEFLATLPELKKLGNSMMFYMFPFENKITVEFRRYNPDAHGDPDRHSWPLRNHTWGVTGPKLARDVENNIHNRTIRYKLLDSFNAGWRFQLENLCRSDNTVPTDQIIDYPPVANDSRYTFSLFAFPEDAWPVAEFYQFCVDYDKQHQYRSNLLDVGYYIAQDQKSLLSYSFDGPVMTLDPVSTANPGWDGFISAYNDFCLAHHGKPLLNQTIGVNKAMVEQAFGARWRTIKDTRRTFDPNDRLLSGFFRSLL